MLDAVPRLFLVAEHHGGGGSKSLAVRFLHYVQPFPGRALVGGKPCCVRNRPGFPLRRPGWNPAPRPLSLEMTVATSRLVQSCEVHDLRRRKGVHVNGKPFLDEAEHLLVEGEGEFGVVAALHEDLRSAQGNGFLDFLCQLIAGEDVALRMSRGPEEGAEAASAGAYVGIVDVPVHHVGHGRFRVLFEPHHVGQVPQMVEVGLFIQFHGLLEIEALSPGRRFRKSIPAT